MPDPPDRSAALYERILEAVPGGVVYVSHDGGLLLANEPAQRFLGLRHDPRTERYVTDFATETFNEDGTICAVEDYPVSRCLATGRSQPPRTIGVRHPNGEMHWAVFTALPFEPSGGGPHGAVVSFVDITERKRAEDRVRLLQAELAQRERLATVGTLAAAVAHEVNNPLAFMFLGLENARVGLEVAQVDREEIENNLHDVQQGATRVRDIVRDLMTFSKIKDTATELSDVNEAIKTAVRLSAPELRYRAQVVFDLRATGQIRAAGRLSQVVLNLVLNAGRSFPTSTGEERVEVTSQNLDGDIVIDVIDNGPGVDLDLVDRIFDPFFTTREDGSGLGLAISRSLIEEMGGTLELVTRARPGACFRITLPKSAPTGDDPPVEEPPAEAGYSVLLVDDEDVIRRLGAAALRPNSVRTAESVAGAIEALESGSFDLVLCDTMLLDGAGLDVYHWLEENQPAMLERFIFISGGTFTERVEEFFATHEVPLLRKPFGRDELQQKIDSVLVK